MLTLYRILVQHSLITEASTTKRLFSPERTFKKASQACLGAWALILIGMLVFVAALLCGNTAFTARAQKPCLLRVGISSNTLGSIAERDYCASTAESRLSLPLAKN
jgi:hypothetical protein